MAQPLINGQSYSWSQIEVRILNVPVAGITAISYEESEEMQDNWGAGKYPVSRGYGKIEATGSITLEMNEVEALQAAVPTGRLQDIPEFDIVVSYLPQGGNIVTHTLKNCRFKNNKREVNQGDMTIAVELELLISHIQWT